MNSRKNRLNYLKSISKRAYFCKDFDLCKGNLKATWKLIGTLIKRKTNNNNNNNNFIASIAHDT